MTNKRALELTEKIDNLDSQTMCINSLISNKMMEANQLDLEITELTRRGLDIKAKMAELKYELGGLI